MVDLPRELWDSITGYLNNYQLWKLRNVNYILRQVAFDRHFNAICFRAGHLGKLDRLQALSFLGDPVVAPRVQKLCFAAGDWGRRPYRIEGLPKPTPFSLATAGLDAISRLYDLLRWRFPSTTAHQLLTSFENVNEIFIECVYSSGMPHGVTNRELLPQIPLLVSAFESYTAKLTTISLAIGPTEAMVEFLTSLLPLPPFPYLERISFEFRGPNYIVPAENYPTLLSKTLSPFLNKHYTTISFLCLSTDEYIGGGFQFDLSFLSGLKRMPKLRTLKTYLPFGLPSATQRLRHFLEEHAETLRHLTLQVQLPRLPVEDRVTLMSLYTPLPHLQHLQIKKLDLPEKPTCPLPNFTEYAARYRSTLVTLSLPRSFPISYNEVEQLLATTWPSLVSLQLHLKSCPPEFFDILVDSLPGLKSLSLVVVYFLDSPHDDHGAKETSNVHFIYQMSHRCFSSTSLREIDIMLGPQHFHLRGDPKGGLAEERCCISAILQAFPTVTLANNMPRTELDYLLNVPMIFMGERIAEALELKEDGLWTSHLLATLAARVLTHPMICYDRRY